VPSWSIRRTPASGLCVAGSRSFASHDAASDTRPARKARLRLSSSTTLTTAFAVLDVNGASARAVFSAGPTLALGATAAT